MNSTGFERPGLRYAHPSDILCNQSSAWTVTALGIENGQLRVVIALKASLKVKLSGYWAVRFLPSTFAASMLFPVFFTEAMVSPHSYGGGHHTPRVLRFWQFLNYPKPSPLKSFLYRNRLFCDSLASYSHI